MPRKKPRPASKSFLAALGRPRVPPQGVVIPLDVAVLVANVFLPRNEFKMRSAAPETVKAVTEFKRCVKARIDLCADTSEPVCSGCHRNVTDSPGPGCKTPKEHG